MNKQAMTWKARASKNAQSLLAAPVVLFLAACTSSGVSDFGSEFSETTAVGQTSLQTQEASIDPASTGGIQYAALDTPADQQATLFENSGSEVLNVKTPEELAEERISFLFPQIKHGKCKGGWGKQAKKLDAKRVTPGHPYYIEIRMRHTPPLPIGHTYTAYGRLGPDGEKLDENLIMLSPVGGYAGAGVAGAIPMPGVLEPRGTDCNITPTAAYRVSLTAQQYENLLREIQQARKDKPSYHLFAYNCNHFTSRISESVGIRAPRNKYTSSLVYMYDIIRENENRG